MDYHSHRYNDESVLIRNSSDVLVAVLPACRAGSAVTSHQGLTYGGVIYNKTLGQVDVINVVRSVLDFYKSHGVKSLIYKSVPPIFRRIPGDEDNFALWHLGGQLARRDVSSVIYIGNRARMSKGRRSAIKKGFRSGVAIKRVADPGALHELIGEVVSRHGAVPTHSLEELRLIMARFPSEILALEGRLFDELVCGAIIFDFGNVLHTQYLAASERGREIGALDFLLDSVINEFESNVNYISFGISSVDGGRSVNEGLLFQKEGFGARSLCHDVYEISF